MDYHNISYHTYLYHHVLNVLYDTVLNILCITVILDPTSNVTIVTATHGSYLRDAQPVVCLLHGLSSVVHRFGPIPLIPVRTQACSKQYM